MAQQGPIGPTLMLGATLAFLPCTAAIASSDTAIQGTDEPDTITVIGYRDRLFRDVPLIDELTRSDLTAYGVDSVSELLTELGKEFSDGQSPALMVLVNGRPISNLSEVAGLPSESILRIEVLPEQAALRLGGSAGQKVINFVLRRNFRAATASVAGSLATEGGGREGDSMFSLSHIVGENRLSLRGRVSMADGLLESARGIQPTPTAFDIFGNVFAVPGLAGSEIDPALSKAAGELVTVAGVPAGIERPGLHDFAAAANVPNVSDLGRFRTLRPEQRRYSVSGAIARELSETVTASITGSGNYETSRSLNGLAGAMLLLPPSNPYSPFSNDVAIARYLGDPLRQTARGIGGHLGLKVNAELGPWSLTLTGEYGRRWARTLTGRGVDTESLQFLLSAGDPSLNPFEPPSQSLLGDRLTDRARSRSGNGGLVFVASGPLFRVPAGTARVSIYNDISRSFINARLVRPDLVATGERVRTDAGSWLNVELPITSRKEGPTAIIGDLSGHFSAAVRSVSDVGTLRSYGYGFAWTPTTGIKLTGSMKSDRQPPSLLQLASPAIETDGVRLFDFVRGETVEVTQVGGGNRDLAADRRRTLALGMDILPLGSGKLRISAQFKRIRLDEQIVSLVGATPALQSAFPERFIRDSDGRLVRVDSRLANFAYEDRRQLHWGFAFRRTPGSGAENGSTAEPDGDSGSGLRLSLFHTWVLKDEILLRTGVPTLDLLDGGAIGGSGGQPRHLLQWEIGANRGDLGARIMGNWRGGTRVSVGPDDGVGMLQFRPLLQHDLRLFANMGGRFPSWTWARDTRLSLNISNLLNERQKVRDADGITPLIYQPAYLDPLGRTVSIGLRKALF